MKFSNHGKDFYAVRISCGQEKSFLKSYQRMLQTSDSKCDFGKVYIRWAVCVDHKHRKKAVFTENLWPGYVIVEMNLNSQTIKQLHKMPAVIEILGKTPGSHPHPISADEIESLLELIHVELTA